MDPDGPETCGSGFGFLYLCLFHWPVFQEHQHQGEVWVYRAGRGRGCGGRRQRTRREILQRWQVRGIRYPVPSVPDTNWIRIQSGH